MTNNIDINRDFNVFYIHFVNKNDLIRIPVNLLMFTDNICILYFV